MHGFFILKGKKPVQCKDVLKWARWIEFARRNKLMIVKQEEIGDARVSTVFLGIDPGFGFASRARLFETRVFGGKFDDWQQKYTTWEEAEEGHAALVECLKAGKALK